MSAPTAAPAAPTPAVITPGWSTTEFWGKLLVQLVALVVLVVQILGMLGWVHTDTVGNVTSAANSPQLTMAVTTVASFLAMVVPELWYITHRSQLKAAAIVAVAGAMSSTGSGYPTHAAMGTILYGPRRAPGSRVEPVGVPVVPGAAGPSQPAKPSRRRPTQRASARRPTAPATTPPSA